MSATEEKWQQYGKPGDREAGFHLLKENIPIQFVNVPESKPKELPASDIASIKKGQYLLHISALPIC